MITRVASYPCWADFSRPRLRWFRPNEVGPAVTLVIALFLSTPAFTADTNPEELLRQAQFTFDLQLAERAHTDFIARHNIEPNESNSLALAESAVLVAEINRGRYEQEDLDKKARRALGKEIDRVAKRALDALEQIPLSSERYRLEADLYAPMIRSSFRGMKYQKKLEKALEKALELDPENAAAWASLARRPLFADEKHGGNPAEALGYLDKALDLQPDLVQALLFRGVAHKKLGMDAQAEADWQRAVELNPNTADARDRLMNIELPGGEV